MYAQAVNARGVSHSYIFSNKRIASLRNIDLTVDRGDFIAIVGRNGCGKSTLAKHLNMLIRLQEGELTVAGLDTSQEELAWEVRRNCGMVFQNPDNQFVSTVVEEDLAFGLQNFGVPADEFEDRTTCALGQVEMEGFERRDPHSLSGGQKQRIALAGILAVRPSIIVLDEATTMLPPEGRKEVLRIVRRLHDESGVTIIMITHYIDETVDADYVVVMDAGSVVGRGPAREILTDIELLRSAGLEAPFAVRLYHDLLKRGIKLDECPINLKEAEDLICRLS